MNLSEGVQPVRERDCNAVTSQQVWSLHTRQKCRGDATDGRFKEAISFYEPLVQGHLDNLLDVTAIVLANLCVCYIMTSQNDQAEALMRQVERQEEQQAAAVSADRLCCAVTCCIYLVASMCNP